MYRSTAALFLSLLPLITVAAPTSPAPQGITVVFQQEKGTSAKSIQVWNNDETEFYGEACGTSLRDGPFQAHPITFHTDENGHGTLSYGSKIYIIHSKPDVSGGIVCAKRFNRHHSRVDCVVPAQDTYNDVAWYGLKQCFKSEEHRRFGTILNHISPQSGYAHTSQSQLPSRLPERPGSPDKSGESSVPDAKGLNYTKRSDLEERIVMGPVCPAVSTTSTVGDGNPHQNYYDKQLSDNINCMAAPQCQVGQENSQSFSIGFSFDGVLNEWISGGFSVETTWETGNSYDCVGYSNDEVCIWYSTAHTAYTVTNFNSGGCGEGTTSDPFVLFSPNVNNAGGLGYYCVIGPCRAKGEGYWDYSGPAGGPP